MEKLTRKQVIELSKTTGDISGYDLSGLNLSMPRSDCYSVQGMQSQKCKFEQLESEHVQFR